MAHPIERRPSRAAAAALLEAADLPTADLTDAHMEHFFHSGAPSQPTGLVGLEFCGPDALLRSLVVAPDQRRGGLGAALSGQLRLHGQTPSLEDASMKRFHVHVSVADVYSRLTRAEAPVLEEGATTCCYAKGEKSWIEDPQGVQWETFLTTGESTTYGNDPVVEQRASSCCAPTRAA